METISKIEVRRRRLKRWFNWIVDLSIWTEETPKKIFGLASGQPEVRRIHVAHTH
jgi:hypothetical protein